jgi:hypothetical protein
MATNSHTVNNFCNGCQIHVSNGIIRDYKLYCSERCFESKVTFSGVEYREISSASSDHPSSLSRPSNHQSSYSSYHSSHHPSNHSSYHSSHHPSNHSSHHSSRHYHSHSRQSHSHSHHHGRDEKQCNYCFVKFDRFDNPGIKYGPMWFCSQNHLNLANPRPKAMMVPAPVMPIHVAPQVLPHFAPRIIGGPIIGGPIIGGPIIGGPFIHGPIIGGPIIGGPFFG